MKNGMDKKHCRGCRDDFYNSAVEGGCWCLKDAKLEWRIPVGMQESPPYKNKKAVKVPNCWYGSGPYRTLYVKKEALDSNGFWRSA